LILAPSWVIGEKTGSIAKLVPDTENKRYEIEIHENVSRGEIAAARDAGTVESSRLIPPDGGPSTPIQVVRRNLRMWKNEDVVPRPDDVFQERLYCIRWVETYYEMKRGKETIEHSKNEAEALPDFEVLKESRKLKEKTRHHYRAPTRDGLNWLKTELTDYWVEREKIINILDFLSALGRVSGMSHWESEARTVGILAGAIRNDHV